MAAAIPPITGVCFLSLFLPPGPGSASENRAGLLGNSSSSFKDIWLMVLFLTIQMLRRGLVLDLSTAFGEF